MADPKQICYLCERLLESVGRSETTPGICIECDDKHNPDKKAAREHERNIRGIDDPEKSSNPLISKPGIGKPKPLIPKGYRGPQAPYNPPPSIRPAGDDNESPNPLVKD